MIIDITQLHRLREKYNVIPIKEEVSSDTMTPMVALMRLRKKKHQSFFLESVQGGEHVARYSFLGINPIGEIRIDAGHLKTKGEVHLVKAHHPLISIQNFMRSFKAPKLPGFPPFCGGLVGFVGYETVQYMEDIPTKAQDIGCPEAHLMVFKSVVAFDKAKDKIIIISNLLLDRGEFELQLKEAKAEIKIILDDLFRPSAAERVELKTQDAEQISKQLHTDMEQGKSRYVAGVKQLKKNIREGDIFQAVLSERFETKFTGDPFQIYRHLRSMNPSPYMFYLDFGSAVLFGASPEMLLRLEKGIVTTCPIAGTRPRSDDPRKDKKLEQDLLDSVKERAEHLMLVDLGRNDLGRLSVPGTVKVDQFMQVEKFSNVMHLVSIVTGKIKRKYGPWEALMACFPAGTLSGAPKIRAMQLIEELEPVARGPYGGAVVYHDFAGSFDSCIVIRSAYVKDKRLFYQAGAGIVADSRPEKEWQEVLHKTRSLRGAIAQATHDLEKRNQ